MRVIAIVQARMQSTRLPGKVLLDICGRPMASRVCARVAMASRVDDVIVATSDTTSDDAIWSWCEAEGLQCFRGSEHDVLDRFYHAVGATGVKKSDAVVRITADCPLIDPAVIDLVVDTFQATGSDYVSNVVRPTFPDGLDTEVFTVDALERAWKDASKPSDREHVTPYLRFSGKFRITGVTHSEDLSRERWTVDEMADLEFIRGVYGRLSHLPRFGFKDVLSLLAEEPALRAKQGRATMNEGYYRSLYLQTNAGRAPVRERRRSEEWLERSKKVIPGCAQTFSKSRFQFVQGVSPIFLQRGKGCRVWDVDGNEYIDYIQGLLPNILGYAHEEVNAAYLQQLSEGHSFSLPHPREVELAENLKSVVPCAEMARFGKNGSDATAGAVRAARAFTGRERIACCGYHGWQDWYIGTTTRNAGVPVAVRELTHPFPYNDLGRLGTLLEEHPGEFAAVILEPFNFAPPVAGFLEGVRDLAHRNGALLIFDEICTGFHFGLGGAQARYKVVPDLACFGKAMGNGFPISCVVGKADVMAIFSEIFFSFTFGGEVASMAAALKVIEILRTTDALATIASTGRKLQDGFNALAREAGLAERLQATGFPEWTLLRFKDASGNDSLLVRSLFQQECVKRGILGLATHNLTAAHCSLAIEQTLEVYAAVLKTLAQWLDDPRPDRHLEGEMIQPVFRVR